jgi:hypothetical protein
MHSYNVRILIRNHGPLIEKPSPARLSVRHPTRTIQPPFPVQAVRYAI